MTASRAVCTDVSTADLHASMKSWHSLFPMEFDLFGELLIICPGARLFPTHFCDVLVSTGPPLLLCFSNQAMR